jgi:hypothetical protein
MSPIRIILGILICLAALCIGVNAGLMLAGFGICAVGFAPGLVGSAALAGAVLGGSMALVWPKAWWSGALAFSAPMLLGVTSPEWQRAVSFCICIAAACLAALVVRYPGPRKRKS